MHLTNNSILNLIQCVRLMCMDLDTRLCNVGLVHRCAYTTVCMNVCALGVCAHEYMTLEGTCASTPKNLCVDVCMGQLQVFLGVTTCVCASYLTGSGSVVFKNIILHTQYPPQQQKPKIFSKYTSSHSSPDSWAG